MDQNAVRAVMNTLKTTVRAAADATKYNCPASTFLVQPSSNDGICTLGDDENYVAFCIGDSECENF